MRSTVVFVFISFLAGVTIAEESTECDSISTAYLLRCMSPLLQNARHQMHPTIFVNDDRREVRTICPNYADFKYCAPFDLRRRCEELIAVHESVYDYVCSDDVRENLTASSNAKLECMARADVDTTVVLCEQNATAALRNVASVDALTMKNRRSLQCEVMQNYVDCIRGKYVQLCGEDVWDIKEEIVRLATVFESTFCNLTASELGLFADHTKPVCKPNASCTCANGFEFDNRDPNICMDSNECEQSIDNCSQRCQNTVGSYKCSCDERFYELDTDGHSCLPKNRTDKPYIFFAHGQSLWNISIDGKDFQLQRAGLEKTAMLDFDAQEKMLYYLDIGANKLERIRFEGAFPQTLQSFDVEGTEGIGVDWVARKLYSVKGANMYVQELDGRFRRTLYREVFKLPRALAIHALTGHCYASDWGANAFIARASLDGSDFRRIITSGLVWPNGLTIDYYSEKLYWADAFLDVIECSRLDGTQRRTVLHDSNTVPHPFGLAIMDDYIYWTDWTNRGILRADKRTGENATVIAQTALLPYGIKIFYSAVQPEAENPCGSNNGGCSQLCLSSPVATNATSDGNMVLLNYTCACADGFQLDKDGRTCVSRCSDKEIQCKGDDPRCISKIYWCDGVSHCRDNADEADCPPRLCLPNQFQCHSNKTCIASSKLCDGTKNCDDESDEAFCQKK